MARKTTKRTTRMPPSKAAAAASGRGASRSMPPLTPGSFRAAAQDLLDFISASPSQFHAAEEAVRRLEEAGFVSLPEEDAWDLEPGGRYLVVRNESSVAAWIQGTASPAQAGFRLIGAHTDSPALRLKPEPVFERHGYVQLGVEVYGGPLLPGWMDADLGLAGRVALEDGRGGVESRLFHAARSIATPPQLAIHLNREVNDKGLQVNAESHLAPILALSGDKPFDFRTWLGKELGVRPDRILDHELYLYDRNPPSIFGLNQEFIHSARIDNLASCHAAVSALVSAPATAPAPVSTRASARGSARGRARASAPAAATEATRLIILFDNEEVGSSTKQGAAGSFLEDVLGRISRAGGEPQAFERARALSFLVSADLAHAVHPNYADKHEPRHMPRLNAGPVIKYNAKARYSTDAASGALFQTLCRQAGVPCQKFVMRADLPCGSTIGPLAETRLGIRTVDVGNPMLAMHSNREMAGLKDQLYMIRALEQFLA